MADRNAGTPTSGNTTDVAPDDRDATAEEPPPHEAVPIVVRESDEIPQREEVPEAGAPAEAVEPSREAPVVAESPVVSAEPVRPVEDADAEVGESVRPEETIELTPETAMATPETRPEPEAVEETIDIADGVPVVSPPSAGAPPVQEPPVEGPAGDEAAGNEPDRTEPAIDRSEEAEPATSAEPVRPVEEADAEVVGSVRPEETVELTPETAVATPETRPETEANDDTVEVADAVLAEEADVQIDPDFDPDVLDSGPGVDTGLDHQQDLLPGDSDTEEDAEEESGELGGGNDPGDGVDLGLVETDLGAAEMEQTADDDPFGLGLDNHETAGNSQLSDHEQGVFDELSEDPLGDPLGDPVVAGEEVPDEYDLSGSETGDGEEKPLLTRFIEWLTEPADGGEPAAPGGPTNANPFPGMKYTDEDGFVPREEGEDDPDRTTELEQRLEFEQQQQQEQEQEPAGQQEEQGLWDSFVSWFDDDDTTESTAPAEDYAPESQPIITSPSHDPGIGDVYFGIGAEADRTSETQYSDVPEDGDDGETEYDGVDYGEHHSDPDFDINEADTFVYTDPLDQPDVDPVEDTAESGAEDDALADLE